MVLPLSYKTAGLVTRFSTKQVLSCARFERSRSHYHASSSHSAGYAEGGKSHPKKGGVRAKSLGNSLSSLTIQPLQRSSKGSGPSWSSGIVCTEENCSYKTDARTLEWLKELFDGLDTDRYGYVTADCCAGLLLTRAHVTLRMLLCRDGGITKTDLKTLIRQTNNHLGPVALVRPFPAYVQLVSLYLLPGTIGSHDTLRLTVPSLNCSTHQSFL